MKHELFRIRTASMIMLVITACGGKPNISGLPTTEKNSSKSSDTLPTINVKLPHGIFINTQNGYGVTYCNLQGQIISEFKTPGIICLSPGEVVIAGIVIPGTI